MSEVADEVVEKPEPSLDEQALIELALMTTAFDRQAAAFESIAKALFRIAVVLGDNTQPEARR
jgi:hypothetical protein